MSRLPELGECITLADYDSDPWLLVVAVDVPEGCVRAVLCADLAEETRHRLGKTVGDREGRRELARAVREADLATFEVPRADLERIDGAGIQGCARPGGQR